MTRHTFELDGLLRDFIRDAVQHHIDDLRAQSEEPFDGYELADRLWEDLRTLEPADDSAPGTPEEAAAIRARYKCANPNCTGWHERP